MKYLLTILLFVSLSAGAQTLNHKITGRLSNGFVTLREVNDTARYFYYNKDGGFLAWGLCVKVSGLDARNYSTSQGKGIVIEEGRLEGNANAVLKQAGSSSFSFCINQFDLYILNGTKEVFRGKQFVWMKPGKARALGMYNLEDLKMPVRTLPAMKVLSKPGHINPKDLGAHKGHTKGNFKKVGYEMEVDDPSLFPVGSLVMMATGGEQDKFKAGERKAEGVGYTWPGLRFDNLDAMQKATNYPQGTYAYAADSRIVYQYYGAWFPRPNLKPVAGLQLNDDNWYESAANPQGYRGRVVKKYGHKLTMDTKCNVPSFNADVWFDNKEILNSITAFAPVIPTSYIVDIDDSLALSERWYVSTGHSNWKIAGTDTLKHVLFTPQGFTSVTIDVQATNHHFSYESFQMNGGSDSVHYTYRQFDTQYGDGASRIGQLGNVTGIVLTDSSQAVGMRIKDYMTGAIGIGGNDSKIYNCTVTNRDGAKHYMAWVCGMTGSRDTVEGGFWGGPQQMGWIETFGGDGDVVRGVKGRNLTFSSNGGQMFVIEYCDLTYDENGENDWQARSNHIINLNNNNGYNSGYGGILRRIKVHYNGYTDLERKLLTSFIGIQSSVNDVLIQDIIATVDEKIRDLPETNLHIIDATGGHVVVERVSVEGHAPGQESGSWNFTDYNVAIRDGSISDSKLWSLLMVEGVKESNNTVLRQKTVRPPL